jgi:hypothetical protein
MTCDLETLFGQLSQTIPTSPEESRTVLLSAQTLPVPRSHLASDRLLIKKCFHEYGPSRRVNALWFQAHHLVYRQLGLLLLSVVFAPEAKRIHLELTYPASDIKHLLIDYPYRDDNPDVGFVTRLYGFQYTPAVTGKHPWIGTPHVDPSDLPVFYLTNQESYTVTEEQEHARNTVVGFGFEAATTRLAELFLNMSLPHNPVNEYVLEGEGEYRGVGIHSAEVRFFLPGSLGWDDLL